MIKTVCYGKEEIWEDRGAAIRAFTEAMYATAGSAESERYANILTGLLLGKSVCKDYE